MSDTPETDAKASPHIGFFSCATVPAEFARSLERERDEAIRQRNETNRSSKYACYSYYQEKLKSERELNDLRDRLNEILNPPPLKHPHETGGGGMGTLPK
jgi:hypothetical protein